MQVRCVHCGVPFSLGKETIHAALNEMAAQDLRHFDFRCPMCRKTNRLSRERMERAAPDWVAGKQTEETGAE